MQKDSNKVFFSSFRLAIMPKSKYLTTPVKELIVRAKQEGKTCKQVAQLFNVNASVVSRVCKRFKEEGVISLP